jgi:hypothetical protein
VTRAKHVPNQTGKANGFEIRTPRKTLDFDRISQENPIRDDMFTRNLIGTPAQARCPTLAHFIPLRVMAATYKKILSRWR